MSYYFKNEKEIEVLFENARNLIKTWDTHREQRTKIDIHPPIMHLIPLGNVINFLGEALLGLSYIEYLTTEVILQNALAEVKGILSENQLNALKEIDSLLTEETLVLYRSKITRFHLIAKHIFDQFRRKNEYAKFPKLGKTQEGEKFYIETTQELLEFLTYPHKDKALKT